MRFGAKAATRLAVASAIAVLVGLVLGSLDAPAWTCLAAVGVLYAVGVPWIYWPTEQERRRG